MPDDEIVVEELEIEPEEEGLKPQAQQQGQAPSGQQGGGKQPDYRIVQGDTDRDGKKILRNVGGIWVKTSKAGQEFFSISIGQLRLLAFKNDPNRKFEQKQL